MERIIRMKSVNQRLKEQCERNIEEFFKKCHYCGEKAEMVAICDGGPNMPLCHNDVCFKKCEDEFHASCFPKTLKQFLKSYREDYIRRGIIE